MNALKNAFARLKPVFSRILPAIHAFLTRNTGLKILSIVLALLLWSYVVTTNPAITRGKILNDVPVSVSGETILASRNMALLTDIESVLPEAAVRLTVPQSAFSLATTDNVRVDVNLSDVRTTGTQRITLRGTTVYGDIVQVIPEYMDVMVERLDSREVPVNVRLENADTTHYRYITRSNPASVTISGPASIVQTVTSAEITVDVTDITSSQVRAEPFLLCGSDGSPIARTLTSSTSSVLVYLDVYPARTLPIRTSMEDVLTGTLPTGYEITQLTVTPQTALVAADESLLYTIDSLSVEKIDISEKTASFTQNVNLNSLNGLKYISTDQVTVSVTINEIETTRTFENIPLTCRGSAEGADTAIETETVSVVVTGRYTQVEQLTAEDLSAAIDLTGLEAGQYTLPVTVTAELSPSLMCTVSPAVVNVTVAEPAE